MRFDGGSDQAEGLRRLLLENRIRLVSVLGGKQRVGKTGVTVNLAAALARSGKDVLVLDENDTPNNVADNLGLHARYDLLDVVQGRCTLREACLGRRGLVVLPAARAHDALGGLGEIEQRRLANVLDELSQGVDVVLVDASSAAREALPEGAALLLVMDATTSGITESYALIKRLAMQYGRLRFEVLVNKVDDQRAAQKVFGNMAALARRDLSTRLEYAGYIPRDDKLHAAVRLGKPVLEAFPNAVSAPAFLRLAQTVIELPVHSDGQDMDGLAALHAMLGQRRLPTRYNTEAALVVN